MSDDQKKEPRPARLPIGPHRFKMGDVVRLGGVGIYVVLRSHGVPTAGDEATYDIASLREGVPDTAYVPTWRLTRVVNPKPDEVRRAMERLMRGRA